MRTFVAIVAVLAAIPGAAQKPWETRTDLRLPAPIELPAVPAVNPFFTPLAVQPAILSSPLVEKFPLTLAVQAAIYIDAAGSCQRVVFTDLPLPGLAAELDESISETRFTPGRRLGADVPTWLTLAVDLEGRVDEGKVLRLAALPPDPRTPEVPDSSPVPTPEARDWQLPTTPVEQLDQPPLARRFRARVASHTWRQPLRFLAEVGASGRCERVVFLTCPEGLRPWLLASLAAWTFQPAQDRSGVTKAWVTVDGEVAVDVSTLRADTVRLIRRSSYPGAAAAPGGGFRPGA
jgi:hypothetical protein